MIRLIIRISVDDIEDDLALAIKREVAKALVDVPDARLDFSLSEVPDRPV